MSSKVDRLARVVVPVLITLAFSGSCAAQDYVVWLNQRIDEVVPRYSATRINLRSNTNQTETSSMSGNSTSLVDQSSVADLIGVALNLAELSGSSTDGTEATSASVTVTAYAIYSAFKGADPLNPSFYSRHRNWRKLSLSLGYDNEMESGGAPSDRATLVGVKYLISNRRDASDPAHAANLGNVSRQLRRATAAFANINPEVRRYLYDRFAQSVGITADGGESNIRTFAEQHLGKSDKFQALLQQLRESDLDAIDEIIAQHIDPFVSLDLASRQAVEAIRRAPQFSLAVSSKLRRDGADEYMAESIFDYGLHPRVNFTANGAFEFKDNKTGPDSRGGKVSTQFAIQITPENQLAGRKPLSLAVAGDGTWMTGRVPVYRWQTKFSIPVMDGIDFPVSFTFASRSDLIQEKEIRGQFGFTFDVSRLLAIRK